ncbi:MAG: EAL domain-containing protein, partial [Oscillospiraceae bacterium]|nr:EAL domain-containing protein [Oscillospiraceae bacterium]
LSRIPVIVLTGERSAELRSLELGAADFLTKPYDMPEVIRARVKGIIELSEGRNIISAAEKDALTGLYSASFFFEYAQQLEKYHPDQDMDAVAINIDRFHLVNELYGREFGDRALTMLGHAIKDFLSTTDGIGCRQDADAFFVYCLHRESYDEVLAQLEEGLDSLLRTVRLRLRIGVYANLDRSLDVSRQFDRAKTACAMLRDDYSRSVLVYDNALYQNEVFTATLLGGVHRAIQDRQLKVFYQPQYDIRGGEPVLCSAEALVRWEHPELGMISPGSFLPLFEENGLIQLVDHYVRHEAARQIKEWQTAYGVRFPLAVNLSRFDLYDPALADELRGLLSEFDLTADDLLLELTESAYTVDVEQLDEAVEALRAAGFRVGMDNFGAGGFALGALFTVPIDQLKLDMKYVRYIWDAEARERLIRLIMDAAGYLGIAVVAESVETEEECELLRGLGCNVVQGRCFSSPETPEEFSAHFEK